MGYLCANLVFLGLSVLDLGPMYATDRQTSDVRQHHRLMLLYRRVHRSGVIGLWLVLLILNAVIDGYLQMR